MTPWDEAYRYVWFAERYGWHPHQVDELPWWLAIRFPLIATRFDAHRQRAREQRQGG